MIEATARLSLRETSSTDKIAVAPGKGNWLKTPRQDEQWQGSLSELPSLRAGQASQMEISAPGRSWGN